MYEVQMWLDLGFSIRDLHTLLVFASKARTAGD